MQTRTSDRAGKVTSLIRGADFARVSGDSAEAIRLIAEIYREFDRADRLFLQAEDSDKVVQLVPRRLRMPDPPRLDATTA